MKKLKAFTLIEMLIVLVIIGIMMMVTLRFGGNFVNDTSFKQERDTLLTDYHIAL
jgi:prepilin-type N-terminal cleavage/methylation domain-containing protein